MSFPPSFRHVAGGLVAALLVLPGPRSQAQDWATVPIINHSTYQAVNGTGGSAYPAGAAGFPLRLRGVVTQGNQDWLDPTPAYDPYVYDGSANDAAHLMRLGGQAEFFVQTVNLDGTAWDPDPSAPFSDFGGTACWMGQNYGNHPWHKDPAWSYTDAQWTAELNRLGFSYAGGPTAGRIQPGDLVEIRVRTGLSYNGKMNVNEAHSNSASNDWEVVVLESGFGLPQATPLSLADLKTATNQFIFDPTRETGGERHQMSRVELQNVSFAADQPWGKNSDPVVIDASGRSLTIHLGLNDSFTTAPVPNGSFNVTGVLDQMAASGQGGYRLLVMDAGSFVAVPEPSTVVLLCAASAIAFLVAGRNGISHRRG